MKMHPDNPNLPYWWSSLLGLFSLLSLQDYVFIVGALISAFFTIKTYYAKRKEERERLVEERRRTKIMEDYLHGVSAKPESERPAAVEVVAEAMRRAEDDMSISKSKLSAVMLALIAAGASAPVMMSQFQEEKEGQRLTAYQDGVGIWTICGGVTMVNGQKIVKGQRLTAEQCKQIDAAEQKKALDWVDRNVKVTLTEPQKVGIASFCPWNIGPGKCFTSTFYKKLNDGDRIGACREIRRWIYDAGRDCRIRSNNCYGQIVRRDQEAELACWGLDK